MDYGTTVDCFEFYTNWYVEQGHRVQPLGRSADQWGCSVATDEFFVVITVLRNEEVPFVKAWVSITGGAARGLHNDMGVFQRVAGEVSAGAKLLADGTITASTYWQTPTDPLDSDPKVGPPYLNMMIADVGLRARGLGTSLTATYGGRVMDGRADDALHIFNP